jgi:hypothetical protein
MAAVWQRPLTVRRQLHHPGNAQVGVAALTFEIMCSSPTFLVLYQGQQTRQQDNEVTTLIFFG